MATAFILITEALRAAIADLDIADAVTSNRVPPTKKGVQRSINVRLVATDGERAGVVDGPVDFVTAFDLELAVRHTSAEADPAAAVDDMLAALFTALTDLQLTESLAVQEVLPAPAISWDFGEGDDQLVLASLSLTVTHRTQGASLAPWGV